MKMPDARDIRAIFRQGAMCAGYVALNSVIVDSGLLNSFELNAPSLQVNAS